MKDEIIIFKGSEISKSIEVKILDESLWLTQNQIVELFESSKANISEHIRNIYQSKELEEKATVRNFRTVQNEGGRNVSRERKHYNLDMIISIGYRVNSVRGTQFRIWANQVLKDYILKGYVVNQRVENVERRMQKIENRLDEFDLKLNTNLPLPEGLYFEGQIFDAYVFVNELIESSNNSIILIDNYIDESVLLMLTKRKPNVEAIVYTKQISQKLQLDLAKHNAQYPPVEIHTYTQSHDRFLIIDYKEVYHIGASLKDLGKKLFGFSRLGFDAKIILEYISRGS